MKQIKTKLVALLFFSFAFIGCAMYDIKFNHPDSMMLGLDIMLIVLGATGVSTFLVIIIEEKENERD